MCEFKRLAAGALAAALLSGASTAAPALAENVTVTVNGQRMSFDQPPVMRNGRVFVPMRAIFERLGSTVVFSNGVINAQGNGRTVHLTIGSTDATVNGNPLKMDVAPFSVAGRTEVPLRFVAQALGAGVNWNSNTSTVAINTGGGNVNYTPQPAANASFNLSNQKPASGATANNTHPQVHATFSEPVNRDSLKVSIDGRDVTSLVYANANGFDLTPNFELAPGSHKVVVTGRTAAGATFNTGWSFDTAAGSAANYIRNIAPGPGTKVGSSFTLTAKTTPGSKVHVVASGVAGALGGLLQVGTGTFQNDVTADGNGNFSVPISLAAVSGGQIRVIVTSTSPSGASIERQIVYST
jgi:Copper amine oxidase N-terminal domain